MEEDDGTGYKRRSVVGTDILAPSFSQMAITEASNVDLVGKLKTLGAGRKKLMTKYFDIEEVESGPIFSEYFAVSLAFVALGSMIREANVRMRRKDADCVDVVPAKLQRMALDSMLKSAMERLRGLARRTQTLEEKVRDRSYMEAAFQFERLEFLKRISRLEATIAKHVEAEAAWRKEKDELNKRIADVDAQRGYFFKKMGEAETFLSDLQRLRMEDGKANAKLVEIYAGREQSWKSERAKLKHEIDLLKERLSRILSQSQVKPSQSFEAAAEALRMRNMKRRPKEIMRDKVISEREFNALVGVDMNHKPEADLRSRNELHAAATDRKDLGGVDVHEPLAHNQEMEEELAIILKRVGAMKRRGTSGSKLDELLNEAKDKPELKRLGSFDQAPRSLSIDSTPLLRPEAKNMKDVEIDDEGSKDIWQAIEVQECKNVQGSGNIVDEENAENEPSLSSLLNPTDSNREKLDALETNASRDQSSTAEGSTLGEHTKASLNTVENAKLTSDSTALTSAEEASTCTPIEGCWEEPAEATNNVGTEPKGCLNATAESNSADETPVTPVNVPVSQGFVDSLKLFEDDLNSGIVLDDPACSSPASNGNQLDLVDDDSSSSSLDNLAQLQASPEETERCQVSKSDDAGLPSTAMENIDATEVSTGTSVQEIVELQDSSQEIKEPSEDEGEVPAQDSSNRWETSNHEGETEESDIAHFLLDGLVDSNGELDTLAEVQLPNDSHEPPTISPGSAEAEDAASTVETGDDVPSVKTVTETSEQQSSPANP